MGLGMRLYIIAESNDGKELGTWETEVSDGEIKNYTFGAKALIRREFERGVTEMLREINIEEYHND